MAVVSCSPAVLGLTAQCFCRCSSETPSLKPINVLWGWAMLVPLNLTLLWCWGRLQDPKAGASLALFPLACLVPYREMGRWREGR